jgi:hypothetical protein
MRRLAIAAFMIALLPLTAYAQDKSPLQAQEDQEKQRRIETEKEYQDTIKRLKASSAPAAPVDPWQSVRPAPSTTDTSKR